MLAKCLALEYAPIGIRVNCLAPGLVDSGRVKAMLAGDEGEAAERVRGIPLGRLGDPEQIAAAAAFLLSPENEFMTGAIVPIDGGALAG